MNKSDKYKIIILSVLVSFGLTIFFGRYITAKISTLPFLNKLHILSPQAPIVINNKEEIRVSDSGEAISAAEFIKSKVSVLVYANEGNLDYVSTLVNLTSDGIFALPGNLNSKLDISKYFILDSSGKVSPVVAANYDKVSDLSLVQTKVLDSRVAPLGDWTKLKPAEKVILISAGLDGGYKADTLFVKSLSSFDSNKILSSDIIAESFQLSESNALKKGSVIINTKGEVLGMTNELNNIITSETLRFSLANFILNKKAFVYSSYGFNYRVIFPVESKILNKPEGFLVTAITPKSASLTAGLQVGDVITKINKQAVLADDVDQKILFQNQVPGGLVEFEVVRKQKVENLKFAPNIVK